MSKELINIINNKCTGRPYRIERYVHGITKIIAQVYKRRYYNIWLPDKGIVQSEMTLEKASEPALFGLSDGAQIINYETFVNWCWDKLEDEHLIDSAHGRDFLNDNGLESFLFKSLENLLQEKIYELTPGLETRKKQVSRVLKSSCRDITINGKRCWVLSGTKVNTQEPATIEQLLEVAKQFKEPEPVYPKKKDSDRGPSIKDKEMKDFLINVLKAAGGVASINNIISLIKVLYGFETVKNIIPVQQEDDEPEDMLGTIAFKADRLFLSQSHFVIAQEMFDGMDYKMKNLYSKLFIEDNTIEMVAKDMQCSLGTIDNRKKELTDYISTFFTKCSYEECNAILSILPDLFKIDTEAKNIFYKMEAPYRDYIYFSSVKKYGHKEILSAMGLNDANIKNISESIAQYFNNILYGDDNHLSAEEIEMIKDKILLLSSAEKDAGRFVESMDKELIDYYRFKFVKELKNDSIIKKMNITISIISNLQAKLSRHITSFYKTVKHKNIVEECVFMILNRGEES